MMQTKKIRKKSAKPAGGGDEALKDSETRYRRLFETAKDGILILDGDTGEITDVNPFLVKMLGYSQEEFLGKNSGKLALLKISRPADLLFGNFKRKNTSATRIYRLKPKTGSTRMLSLSAMSIWSTKRR
jgi:PAS domain S-box-containing protein